MNLGVRKIGSGFNALSKDFIKNPRKEILRRRLNLGKKKCNLRKIFIIFSFFGLLFATFAFLGIVLVFAVVAKDLPDPDIINSRLDIRTSFIYDRNGKLLSELFNQEVKRTPVKFEDMPKHLRDAVVAVEDKRFYEHKGIDPIGLVRSFVKNVSSSGLQGASTLTQQFMRNTLLSEEKYKRTGLSGYKRKLKEMILAIQIEQKFTKDEILRMYLNEVPFGDVAYGVGAASELYFGKEVKDLNLPESAMLAAMIQSPSFYNPYGPNRNLLKERRNLVLSMMKEQKMITDEEYEDAIKVPIILEGDLVPEDFVQGIFPPSIIKKRISKIEAPHFVFWVKEALVEMFGEKQLLEGGYKIYTSIDLEIQKLAEGVLRKHKDTNIKSAGANNGAIVAIEPRSGEILAMVGSLDYYDSSIDGQYNVAVAYRQMGSSFKIYDYASAWSKGYTPDTYVYDVVTEFPGWPKSNPPTNFDKSESGPIQMKLALTKSLNIPAIKAMYLGGIEDTVKLAREMGLESMDVTKNRAGFSYGLATSLGSEEIKLFEHTAAYATTVNNGKRVYVEIKRNGEVLREPISILKIEDKDGNIIYEAEREKKEIQALDENVARYLNTVLSERSLRPAWSYNFYPEPFRPAMVKTGTTNDSKDLAIVGGIPQLVVGVWVGNTDNSELVYNATAARFVSPIWKEFLSEVIKLKNYPVENFEPAKSVVKGSCYGASRPMASGISPYETDSLEEFEIDTVSGKLATQYTPEEYRKKVKYFIPRSILYYTDKSAPCTRPAPKDKSDDPQFKIWEEAIKRWVEKNKNSDKLKLPDGVLIGEPPKELDDVHIPENFPVVKILSPKESEVVNSDRLLVDVFVTSKFGVKSIDFILNGLPIRAETSNEKYILDLSENKSGKYSLEVWVIDSVGNIGKSEKVNFLYEKSGSENEQSQEEDKSKKPIFPEIVLKELSGVNGGKFSNLDLPIILKILAKEEITGTEAESVLAILKSGEKINFEKKEKAFESLIKEEILKDGKNEISVLADFKLTNPENGKVEIFNRVLEISFTYESRGKN